MEASKGQLSESKSKTHVQCHVVIYSEEHGAPPQVKVSVSCSVKLHMKKPVANAKWPSFFF